MSEAQFQIQYDLATGIIALCQPWPYPAPMTPPAGVGILLAGRFVDPYRERVDITADPPVPVLVVEDPGALLAAAKREALDRIDVEAGEARRQIGSPGYAIDATYKAKEEEARRYAAEVEASGNPDAHLADYPYIAAGVGIDAATPAGVATLYLAMAAEWHGFNAAVEAVRIAAKQAVATALSPAEVKTLVNAIVWPESAI
ncbi:hypothetical protein [Gimibacter soli]|uniref:DUF4376 domain-containing protein n=1 Tax=Gimibacter soli TaxID=3024400 RepID=A0AAF0BMV0_9PROT|nr:hypothetical protein [Gimibacter soli]WCL55095.1 hypothetical protein PH603_04905 [Gimibacter soli]